MLRPGVSERAVNLSDGTQVKVHKFFCQKCLAQASMKTDFMVTNQLWEKTGLTGVICKVCFEEHIGRGLQVEDLQDAQINLKWRAL